MKSMKELNESLKGIHIRKHRGNIYNEIDNIQNTLINLLEDTIKIRKEIEEVLIYSSNRQNDLRKRIDNAIDYINTNKYVIDTDKIKDLLIGE